MQRKYEATRLRLVCAKFVFVHVRRTSGYIRAGSGSYQVIRFIDQVHSTSFRFVQVYFRYRINVIGCTAGIISESTGALQVCIRVIRYGSGIISVSSGSGQVLYQCLQVRFRYFSESSESSSGTSDLHAQSKSDLLVVFSDFAVDREPHTSRTHGHSSAKTQCKFDQVRPRCIV